MKINEILKEEYAGKSFKTSGGSLYRVLSQEMYTDGVYLVDEDENKIAAGEWMFYEDFILVNESEWASEENSDVREKQFYIDMDGKIKVWQHDGYDVDFRIMEELNLFKTKEKAEEVQNEQLLYRKMKKFQEENDKEVDWVDESSKHYLSYNAHSETWFVNSAYHTKDVGVIYFTTRELAEHCLNKIVIPHKER